MLKGALKMWSLGTPILGSQGGWCFLCFDFKRKNQRLLIQLCGTYEVKANKETELNDHKNKMTKSQFKSPKSSKTAAKHRPTKMSLMPITFRRSRKSSSYMIFKFIAPKLMSTKIFKTRGQFTISPSSAFVNVDSPPVTMEPWRAVFVAPVWGISPPQKKTPQYGDPSIEHLLETWSKKPGWLCTVWPGCFKSS